MRAPTPDVVHSALTVVGGFTSTVTTRLTQRAQARAGQLAHEIARREDLYRDFITAASKTYGDALVSSEPQLPELVGLDSLIGWMRVLSEPRTVACADELMLTLIDTYFSPNQSVRELGTGQLRGSYNGAYFRYTGKQVEPASPATERWVAEDLAAGSEKLLLSYLRSLGDRQYYISSAVAGRGR